MNSSDENPLFQNLPQKRDGIPTSAKKKVIQPLTTEEQSENPAVAMIRGKIDRLYEPEPAKEPNAKEELAEASAAGTHRSKHQQFMYDLSVSGKSLAEIQEAWHKYYQDLPDKEKHEVWEEFYAEHANASKKEKEPEQPKVHPPQQSAPHHSEPAKPTRHHSERAEPRTAHEVKEQLVGKVRSRAAAKKNPHFQSLIFGVSAGFIVVCFMLFGFFNERIIAPFISPSRTVSNTPIITDLNNTVAAGKDPKVIIPKINVEIPVVYDEPSIEEAAVQKALERGVLHYATTPNPGEKGNAVIFGHSSNNILNSGKYKFAFVLLSKLEAGDKFMLEKGGKRYIYKVFDKKVVPPTELSVLQSRPGKIATASLITCDPPGTSINRLVVTGEQISPSPAGNVASSVKQGTAASKPAQLPSNSPSLWSRLTSWL